MVISYKVYVHINKINGKLYVGQTSEDNPENRYKNGKNYMRCPRFYNAILKYGWDNFEHVILVDNLTKELADIVEKELISLYKTTNDKFGYNLMDGGSDGKPNREAVEKMKLNHADVSGKNNPMFNKSHSEKSKQKMSENRPSYIGENNPNFGKKCSDYSKEMTKKANSKPIIQRTKNGEFIKRWESASEASRVLNICQITISKVCNKDKHSHTAGGYKWEYEEVL